MRFLIAVLVSVVCISCRGDRSVSTETTDPSGSAVATPASKPVTPPPGKPTSLTGTSAAGGISLQWVAPSGSVDDYQIVRRRPESPHNEKTLMNYATSTSTSYTDAAVEDSVRYVYRVYARLNDVLSRKSNFVNIRYRKPAAPDTPDTLSEDQVAVRFDNPDPVFVPPPHETEPLTALLTAEGVPDVAGFTVDYGLTAPKTSLDASWSAPTLPDSLNVHEYDIQYRVHDPGSSGWRDFEFYSDRRTTAMNIDGLSPGTVYSVRIRLVAVSTSPGAATYTGDWTTVEKSPRTTPHLTGDDADAYDPLEDPDPSISRIQANPAWLDRTGAIGTLSRGVYDVSLWFHGGSGTTIIPLCGSVPVIGDTLSVDVGGHLTKHAESYVSRAFSEGPQGGMLLQPDGSYMAEKAGTYKYSKSIKHRYKFQGSRTAVTTASKSIVVEQTRDPMWDENNPDDPRHSPPFCSELAKAALDSTERTTVTRLFLSEGTSRVTTAGSVVMKVEARNADDVIATNPYPSGFSWRSSNSDVLKLINDSERSGRTTATFRAQSAGLVEVVVRLGSLSLGIDVRVVDPPPPPGEEDEPVVEQTEITSDGITITHPANIIASPTASYPFSVEVRNVGGALVSDPGGEWTLDKGYGSMSEGGVFSPRRQGIHRVTYRIDAGSHWIYKSATFYVDVTRDGSSYVVHRYQRINGEPTYTPLPAAGTDGTHYTLQVAQDKYLTLRGVHHDFNGIPITSYTINRDSNGNIIDYSYNGWIDVVWSRHRLTTNVSLTDHGTIANVFGLSSGIATIQVDGSDDNDGVSAVEIKINVVSP